MKRYTTLVVNILITTTIFSGAVLASNFVSADDVVDEINITVPVSCSMSGIGMTSHNAEIVNGTYTADIGTTTLHAFCNDAEGFAIYAAGYTGDVIGGTDSNKLVGASTNTMIETGLATSAENPDISNWAMKLAIVSSPTPTYPITLDNGFGSYSAVPNSYTKVAHRDSSTDIGVDAEGATLTTTYAAYISRTQAADIYSGQVIYTLVHPSSEEPLQPQPSTAGCINYFANASTAVGTMGCQSATDGNTITLLASNFSRTGYGFAGWSDKYDYATNSSAKFYGPQEDIIVPTGTTANGLSLYAVWVKSEGSLQDSARVTALCGTNGVGGSLTTAHTDGTANLTSVSALTDQRDDETYAIARLADGNCWMIENLRLEAKNTRTPEKQALAQGYGTSATYGNFGGLADAENSGFSNTYTANSLYYSGTQSGTASIDIGTSNYLGCRMPRYNNWNNQSTSANRPQNPTSNSATNSTTNAGMYSYGNYYTWHAAIADLTYNDTDNQSTTGTSLCPTGWHLPTGGSVTTSVNVTETPSTWREFYNLGYGIMGSVANDSNAGTYAIYDNITTNSSGDTATKAFRKFPNNFLYSGNFITSSANNRGSNGYYWSSAAGNSSSSYDLYLYSSFVSPGTSSNGKINGYSIRCTVSAGT